MSYFTMKYNNNINKMRLKIMEDSTSFSERRGHYCLETFYLLDE